jgi:hypothetical protein
VSGHGGQSPFRLGGDLHLNPMRRSRVFLRVVSSQVSPASMVSEESGSSLSHSFVKAAGEEHQVEQRFQQRIPSLRQTRRDSFAGSLLSMISTDQWFPQY